MNAEDETAFLAEAHRFLSHISYGGGGGPGRTPFVAIPDNFTKASASTAKSTQSRVLSGAQWLQGQSSPAYVFRKRARFSSTHSRCPVYRVSLLGYIPPSLRKTLTVPPATASYEDALQRPPAGKVQSYRHLLPGISRRERHDRGGETEGDRGDDDEGREDDSGSEHDADQYDPEFLDNPELRTGKHRTVINLTSYLASINHFTKAEFLKREINEKFRKLHPQLPPSLTLSQIRNLKLLLLQVALQEGLELSSVARAFVYLEKLILGRAVHKTNRRLIGGCCLLLAAKATDSKGTDYGKLLGALSSRLALGEGELLNWEFAALARLKFKLQIGEEQFGVHLRRILNSLDYSNLQEYLGERMYQSWQFSTDQ